MPKGLPEKSLNPVLSMATQSRQHLWAWSRTNRLLICVFPSGCREWDVSPASNTLKSRENSVNAVTSLTGLDPEATRFGANPKQVEKSLSHTIPVICPKALFVPFYVKPE